MLLFTGSSYTSHWSKSCRDKLYLALSFVRSDRVRLAEIRTESMKEKEAENLIYLASVAENEKMAVLDVIQENAE